MSHSKYNVIVVGSGPAGTLAAYTLAKHGLSTALMEKEKLPRYKTCGGGMVYRVRKMLPVDIQPVAEREFFDAELNFVEDGFFFKVKRERPIITMTMRDSLDHFLAEAAKKAGVELMEQCTVTGVEFDKEIALTTEKGKFYAQFIVAADGAFSPVARLTGWKETRHLIPALEFEVSVKDEEFEKFSPHVRFDIGMIPYGYGWMFPKKNHLSIGVASSKRGKLNLPEYYRKYLELLQIKNIENQTRHGFQIPVTPRKDGFFRKNVLLTGDAAGLADPVTAEGISHAVLSGKLAAEAIIEGKRESKSVEKIYQEKLKAQILSQLTIGRFLGKVLYGQAWLRKALFKRYGHELSEALTDVFMGERVYPTEAVSKIKTFMKNGILKSSANTSP